MSAMSGTKLAGSVSGAYNSTGKISSLSKRKRDKAQMKLRDRMRQKFQGSTLGQARLRPTFGSKPGTLAGTLNHTQSAENQQSNNLHAIYGDGYWRTQQERYENVVHTGAHPHGPQRKDIPLQELVDRIHQRDQHSGKTTRNSLLTIRSYRPPVAPYAIQQHPMIRKMGRVAPIQEPKPKKRNPRKTQDRSILKSNQLVSLGEKESDFLSTEEKYNEETTQSVSSWKPDLNQVPEKRNPEFIDTAVPNYKLQLQQASNLAESRFDFQATDNLKQPLNRYITLPSISSSAHEDTEGSSSSGDDEYSDMSSDSQDEEARPEETPKKYPDKPSQGKTTPRIIRKQDINKVRSSSSAEILSLMKAKKQYKQQKRSDDDFNTLLRTRSRYTSDTKIFKEDLMNVRRLSIISEINSVCSDNQSRPISSTSRTSSRSSVHSLKSVSSLEKIEETKIAKEMPKDHIQGVSSKTPDIDKSITLIKEESELPDTENCSDSIDLEAEDRGEDQHPSEMEIDDQSAMTWISGESNFPESPSPTS